MIVRLIRGLLIITHQISSFIENDILIDNRNFLTDQENIISKEPEGWRPEISLR